jgi:hypothetical protein
MPHKKRCIHKACLLDCQCDQNLDILCFVELDALSSSDVGRSVPKVPGIPSGAVTADDLELLVNVCLSWTWSTWRFRIWVQFRWSFETEFLLFRLCSQSDAILRRWTLEFKLKFNYKITFLCTFLCSLTMELTFFEKAKAIRKVFGFVKL